MAHHTSPPRRSPPLLPLLLLQMSVTLSVLLQLPHQAEALPPWVPPPSQCASTHTPKPYTGAEPPLPELPKQYSLRVEANIIQKRWTTEVEEHYDSVNQRASLAVTFNGSTTVTIFNFRSGERYDIYPNGTCQARKASIDFIGFVKMKRGERPAMATINEILRFGNGFNQTYVGKDFVRGIPVNHWTSCQEWRRAKFQLDFYFADPDYIPASGGDQIPVRIVLNGSANNVGMRHEALSGRHRFEHLYEFVSVRPGPPEDIEVFQVPAGVICKGRQDTKPMPELPDRFEMHTEVFVPESPMRPRQSYLRYDWPHRLLETGIRMAVPRRFGLSSRWRRGRRRGGDADQGEGRPWGRGGGEEDTSQGGRGSRQPRSARGRPAGPAGARTRMGRRRMTPKEDNADEGDVDDDEDDDDDGEDYDDDDDDDEDVPMRLMSVATVMDYRSDVVYFMDKMNMTCAAHPMSEDNQRLGMSHGANLFHVSRKQGKNAASKESLFTYQGQTYVRRILVDVFALEENGFTQELYFRASRDDSIVRSAMSKERYERMKRMHRYQQRPSVLVGMYMKNNTVAEGTTLSSIFREVFRPSAWRWTGLDDTTPSPGSSTEPPKPSSSWRSWRSRSRGDQMAFGMHLRRLFEQRLPHKMVHVYNYQPMHTESSNFQVSLCYPDDQVSQVMLVVRTDYDDDVLQNFAAFSNNMRQALAAKAGLSLLQVSNLVPMPVHHPGANMTTVTFSLLGRPAPELAPNQPEIVQAKKNLETAIQQGVVFSVEYRDHSKSFIVDKDLVYIDYDTVRLDKPPSSTAAEEPGEGADERPPGMRRGQRGKVGSPTAGANTGGDGGEEGSGYSGGTVAGVAITTLALGAAGGLGGAYLIYKRKRCPGDNSMPYQMTT